MGFVNLPLIEYIRERDGNGTFKRLDTGEVVFNNDVEEICSPFIILLRRGETNIQMNHTGKSLEASAVLIKKRYTPQLCKATYCQVREL